MPAFGMVYANRGSLLTASEGEPGGPDLAGGAFVPDPAAGAAALAEPVLPPRLGPASRSRLQRSSCGREGGFRRLREGPRGRVRGAASPRCPACREKRGIFKSAQEDGCNTLRLGVKACGASVNPRTSTNSLQSGSSRRQGPGCRGP
ncbi:hypothetical protein R6Z07F_014498 [Ovis aries]